MVVKLTISYDGTDYAGWQVQDNGITVQQVVETALHTLTGQNIRITGSGRTDAGVHALGQVATFSVNATIPATAYAKALNTYLPKNIRVLSSTEVADDFNARFSAKRKTYGYRLYVSNTEIPVKDRFAVRVDSIDEDLLKQAFAVIKGKHDFKGFSATGSSVIDTVRTVYSLKLKKVDGFYEIQITGNGFLYKMVRFIVGGLLAVAYKKISIDVLNKVLNGDKRPNAIKAMPAKGLTLLSVEYKN